MSNTSTQSAPSTTVKGPVVREQEAKTLLADAATKAATTPSPASKVVSKQEQYRKDYIIMHCGVGSPNSPRAAMYNKMKALCKSIGCSESELVWHLVGRTIEDIAKGRSVKDVIGTVATNEHKQKGTSPGWALVPTTNEAGKATELRILDIDERYKTANMAHCKFFAYPGDDDKARRRQARLCWKEALSTLSLTGLSRANITTPESFNELIDIKA